MILKPQDVVILLKLIAIGKAPWSYGRLAVSLWMSPSEVHAGVKRTIAARLASMRKDHAIPNARNLEEFLVHGLPYVFVPELGEGAEMLEGGMDEIVEKVVELLKAKGGLK